MAKRDLASCMKSWRTDSITVQGERVNAMYKTHVIDDIFGVSELLTEQRYRKELDRYRSLHIYRGMSNSSYKMMTSLRRICKEKSRLLDFLNQYTSRTVRFIIKKEIRWQARDLLDQLNISERVIYPGLDGLSRWLERHYYVKKKDADGELSGSTGQISVP